MKFEDACEVVGQIEEAAGTVVDLTGYDELANELIGDAAVYQT
jgi:hypothetical protein